MGRLFWKIFAWFWLAMLLMGLGMTVTVVRHVRQMDGMPGGPIGRMLDSELRVIAQAIETEGLESARRYAGTLSEGRPLRFEVMPLPSLATQSDANRSGMVRQAESPDGEVFHIRADLQHRARGAMSPTGRMLFGRPGHGEALPWLKITLLVTISALVCLALAWYLSSPTRHLREATRRLAAGDLSTRVAKEMGTRRDEIADLGRDFDVMAERLQELIAAQQQLLNDVSHELRSPLARLRVALELARQRQGSALTATFDRIETETERLDQLVGEVLTLARLQTRQGGFRSDPIDLAELIGTVADAAGFEADVEGKSVRVAIPEAGTLHFTVRGDGELLRRALENVVRNAVRHTACGTAVSIELRQAGEHAIAVDVCDCGPGVGRDFLPKLFEPFARPDASRGRSSGGYGLGLAIACRAVQAHGGTIEARNQQPNGLCVTIELPLARTQAQML